jgi:hypothetical protein
MGIFLGRQGQLYVKAETTYGTAPSLASTNAVRHLDFDITFNPLSRTNAPDRLRTPELRRRVTHQADAAVAFKKMPMWPSGTIGTAPEAAPLFKNLFGATVIGALSTTVASSPTTTGAVLTSVTGLTAGEWVNITISGVIYSRHTTSVNSGTKAVSWEPALPSAPTAGDVVKSGVSYQLASEAPESLYAAHYLLNGAGATLSRDVDGFVLNQGQFDFETNEEPMFSASGPARWQTRPAQASAPASFTTVGTAQPSGITGELRVGTAAYPIRKASFAITNNHVLRKGEYGNTKATAFYRRARRAVEVTIEAYVEDASVIYANAESATAIPIFIQTGRTEGQIWGIHCPLVEFQVPQTPDGDEELVWTFKGIALGSAGNDEISLGAL